MSQRLQACCCESNPCQGPSGSCCFPDGSCRDVACAHYCSQQGGIFRPNVQCSGNPCVPPTQKCNCDDATWRKTNLEVRVTRIWTLTIVEESDATAQAAGLYYKSSVTLFYETSYYPVTQAAIDAGLLPPIPTDNPTSFPFGLNYYHFGNVDAYSNVRVDEFVDTQECCNNVSVTHTVTGPDDYSYDNQGNSDGPYSQTWDRTVFLPSVYGTSGGFCYDCCCQRIPTACAQVGTC